VREFHGTLSFTASGLTKPRGVRAIFGIRSPFKILKSIVLGTAIQISRDLAGPRPAAKCPENEPMGESSPPEAAIVDEVISQIFLPVSASAHSAPQTRLTDTATGASVRDFVGRKAGDLTPSFHRRNYSPSLPIGTIFAGNSGTTRSEANMSLTIPQVTSLAQLAVQAETLIGIDIAAKDPAGRYAAAQVALQVAAAFTAVQQGNAVGAVTAAVQAIVAKLTDPGQIAFVLAVANVGMVWVQMAAQVNGALPLLNATWQGVAGEVAAGITATASAYKAPTT
jgi:hypothetical protein